MNKSILKRKIASLLIICMVLQLNITNFADNTNNKNNMNNQDSYYSFGVNEEKEEEIDLDDLILAENEDISPDTGEDLNNSKVDIEEYEEEPEEDIVETEEINEIEENDSTDKEEKTEETYKETTETDEEQIENEINNETDDSVDEKIETSQDSKNDEKNNKETDLIETIKETTQEETKEDKISTISEVEENTEEIKKSEDNELTKSEIEKISSVSEIVKEETNISTKSEAEEYIEEIEKDIISTDSEANIIATESELEKEEEFILSTYSEIIISTSSESLLYGVGGNIYIEKDTVFDKTLYIENDTTINITNCTLTLATSSIGIVVKDAVLTINAEEDSLILGANYNSVIKAENSELYLNKGSIKAGLDANCIEVIDTKITIEGAKIYGGNGSDNLDKVGNEGKSAIIANQNKKCEIIFNDGLIQGGKGGSGFSYDKVSLAGVGLVENNVVTAPNPEYGPYKGYAGTVGGGDGGDAIIINSEYENLLQINKPNIFGGDGGEGILNIDNQEILYGVSEPSEPTETSYSLRDLGYTTSVKDQGSTNGCWAFSLVSAAETGLIRNEPELAKSMLKAGEELTDLDLSEIHTLNYYYNNQADPLGNAGASKIEWSDNGYSDTEKEYLNRGAIMSSFAIFQSLGKTSVEDKYYLDRLTDKEDAFYSINTLHNNIKNLTEDDEHKNDIKYKATDIVVVDRSDFVSGTTGDIAFHKAMRKYIKEYGSVQLAMSNTSLVVKRDINDKNDTSKWSSVAQVGNGHAVHVVGYDDNFPKENFASSNGKTPASDGALLIKNSYGASEFDSGYFWLSYEHAVASSYQFAAYRFEKKEENENFYYYDSGLADSSYEKYYNVSGYGNKFLIKNQTEKINAVSIYQTPGTKPFKGKISVYRLSDTTVASRTLLYTSDDYITITGGNNYIKLDKDIYASENEYIFVCIENIIADSGVKFSFSKSTSLKVDNRGTSYTDDDLYLNFLTDFTENVSYMKNDKIDWSLLNSSKYNLRVRVITTNVDYKYKVELNRVDPEGATHEVEGSSITTDVKKFGETTLLTNDSLSLTGWNVAGWSFDSEGKTKDFENNKTYTAPELKAATSSLATVKLYSYWEPNNYNIIFTADKTYYSEDIPNVVASYDREVTLANLDEDKIVGASFDGWIYNDEQFDNGQVLDKPNFLTTNGGSMTMIATFSNYRYNVSFIKLAPKNYKGTITGEIPDLKELEYRVDDIVIPNLTYECSGYTFKGWTLIPYSEDIISINQTISSEDFFKNMSLTSDKFMNGQTFNLYAKFTEVGGGGGNGNGNGNGGNAKGGGVVSHINDAPATADSKSSVFDGPASTGYVPTVTEGHMEMNMDGTISYITLDGEKLVGWNKIEMNNETNYYFFNEKGNMCIGWVKDNAGKIYMLSVDGKMMTGNYPTEYGTYKFDTSGKFLGTEEDILKTGLPILETYRGEWSTMSIDGTTAVYVLKNGNNEVKQVFTNGFYEIDDDGIKKIYYFDELGIAKVGIQMIGNKMYYFEMGGENLGVLTYEVEIKNGQMELTDAKDIQDLKVTPYPLTGYEIVKGEIPQKDDKKDNKDDKEIEEADEPEEPEE